MKSTFKEHLTWTEFLEKWESAYTVPEAIGLLYAAIDAEEAPYSRERHLEVLRARIRFFIEAGETQCGKIAAVAQQLIVKRILQQVAPVYPEYREMNQMLLVFLGTRHESLLLPPYPCFIAEYLGKAARVWNDTRSGIIFRHGEIQAALIDALLAWGLVHLLEFERAEGALLSERMRAFLDSESEFRVFETMVRGTARVLKPIESFGSSRGASETEVIRRAVHALLCEAMAQNKERVAAVLDELARVAKPPLRPASSA